MTQDRPAKGQQTVVEPLDPPGKAAGRERGSEGAYGGVRGQGLDIRRSEQGRDEIGAGHPAWHRPQPKPAHPVQWLDEDHWQCLTCPAKGSDMTEARWHSMGVK